MVLNSNILLRRWSVPASISFKFYNLHSKSYLLLRKYPVEIEVFPFRLIFPLSLPLIEMPQVFVLLIFSFPFILSALGPRDFLKLFMHVNHVSLAIDVKSIAMLVVHNKNKFLITTNMIIIFTIYPFMICNRVTNAIGSVWHRIFSLLLFLCGGTFLIDDSYILC